MQPGQLQHAAAGAWAAASQACGRMPERQLRHARLLLCTPELVPGCGLMLWPGPQEMQIYMRCSCLSAGPPAVE